MPVHVSSKGLAGLHGLRCGLRVSEVARLKLNDIDWVQKLLIVEQGKGRKDLVLYLSFAKTRSNVSVQVLNVNHWTPPCYW
ncbi:MAG: site-specific integrase [Acidobacteria bacterium]|nr:site-specific integrase [Acidobacteriota bacterium]